jgi:outer membrane protein TolC
VQSLIVLAKENNPASAAAQHRIHAEHARIGPAGALPDPQVTFGLQRTPEMHVMIMGTHDFDASHITGALPGMTEYSMSFGQGLPWPGKLTARENVAQQTARRSEIGAHETILALEADVLEASLDLLLVQARRGLLASQLGYWAATEEAAKAGLDQGGGSASDAIQAMQEQSRIKLRLLELDSQIQDQKDLLNQLAARGQDAPIDLGADILNLELPPPPDEKDLLDDLKARSPEWLGSAADIQIADASVRSAKMERFPDFHVGAVMAKAGSAPMGWMIEAGVGLPIWSKRKQNKAVTMAQAERNTAGSAQALLGLNMATKARERARAWKLADATARLYEGELIPQGQAALEILIARHQNGGASFGAMVGALNGLLSDQERHLDAVAQIHRIAILQHRASLGGAPAQDSSAAKTAAPKAAAMPSGGPM